MGRAKVLGEEKWREDSRRQGKHRYRPELKTGQAVVCVIHLNGLNFA